MERLERFALLLLVALPLVGSGSCDSADSASPTAPDARGSDPAGTVELPATVTLAIGDTVVAQPNRVEVSFAAIVEDSRCPIDVTCVWAGRAVVGLEIGGGGDLSAVELEVGGQPAVLRGLRISATALDPDPREGQEIRPEEYRLELELELAEG